MKKKLRIGFGFGER